MKIYERYGFTDFVLALGYKGEVIKDYFLNYHARQSNVTVHLKSGRVNFTNPDVEDWQISLVDTGAATMTGGRLLRLKAQLKDGGTFLMTYGDGLSDVDLTKVLAFHRVHGKLATVTAVRPPARFGDLRIENGCVRSFEEKPQTGEGWINGGFFVLEPGVFDLIDGDETIFEKLPMEELARQGQLMTYQHPDYWQCMDTLRDRLALEDLWLSGRAPWKT
jgi:glucose-1-phosphate cytidylyltransferase